MSNYKSEKDYLSSWVQNAKQHFEDGDYEWLCDFIQKCFPDKTCKRILELGCGAGFSTLIFLLRDYQVVSIDINNEAIIHTDRLIKEHDYTSKIKTKDEPDNSQVDALLWKKDLVHEWGLVNALVKQQESINPINVIVLCNPGGNLSALITKQELDLLRSGGFSDEEISENLRLGFTDLLHKWAIIYAACALSRSTGIPLLIVEREIENEVQSTLDQISKDATMVIVKSSSRPIKNAPNGGTFLMNTMDTTGQLYWGAALYIPVDFQ